MKKLLSPTNLAIAGAIVALGIGMMFFTPRFENTEKGRRKLPPRTGTWIDVQSGFFYVVMRTDRSGYSVGQSFDVRVEIIDRTPDHLSWINDEFGESDAEALQEGRDKGLYDQYYTPWSADISLASIGDDSSVLEPEFVAYSESLQGELGNSIYERITFTCAKPGAAVIELEASAGRDITGELPFLMDTFPATETQKKTLEIQCVVPEIKDEPPLPPKKPPQDPPDDDDNDPREDEPTDDDETDFNREDFMHVDPNALCFDQNLQPIPCDE